MWTYSFSEESGLVLDTGIVHQSENSFITVFLINKTKEEITVPVGPIKGYKTTRHDFAMYYFSVDHREEKWRKPIKTYPIRRPDSEVNPVVLKPGEATELQCIIYSKRPGVADFKIYYEVTAEFGKFYNVWNGKLETTLSTIITTKEEILEKIQQVGMRRRKDERSR